MNFGPIPDGLWVLHRCDNPPCVRPDHLFLGTAADNSADMMAKGRAACQSRPEGFVREFVERVRRLSDADLTEALQRSRLGESSRSIARAFGCSHTTISRLVNGTHWREAVCRDAA
jgi:hypothetical protein